MNSTTDDGKLGWTGSDIPEEDSEKMVMMGSGGKRWESESKPVGYYSSQLSKRPSDITNESRGPRYVTIAARASLIGPLFPAPPDLPGIWHLASTTAVVADGGHVIYYTWENAEEFYD